MEGRMKKYRQTSPERTKVWTEPSHNNQNRKVPVVYYLCRNRHLEHPHFVEVPLSSPEGLYMRDVISRLNHLRGRGMPSMYSWSCKRTYKNGFVWHDLCEDDLILPAHGNEYILKGSELFEESHSGRGFYSSGNTKVQTVKQLQEPSSSRSEEASLLSSSIVVKEKKPSSQDEEFSPLLQRPNSSSLSLESGVGKNTFCGSSMSLTEYKVCKADGAADASTQTEESVRRVKAQETCTRGVSTDDGPLEIEYNENHLNQVTQAKENSEICRDEISPPPSSSSTSSGGKTETLESLMRSDATRINSFRIVKEEEIRIPNTKFKASNMLMQLISCGSISVKDHNFGVVPTYRPSFSHSNFPSPLFSCSTMLGELDCPLEIPRLIGLGLEEKEYFSGSLIETKTQKEDGDGFTILKRSSSYNADRTSKSSHVMGDKEEADSAQSLSKQTRCETVRSPVSEGPNNSSEEANAAQLMPRSVFNDGIGRITAPSSINRPSKRLDSFREEKENVVRIEES